MIRGLKASLDYYTREFGPYPFDHVRIVEFPRYANFARALPGVIPYSEGNNFITRVDEGEFDRPLFVVAHEMAHQWWGGRLRGAAVRGRGFLSESMAQYSAMMVIEELFGRDTAWEFYDYQMRAYLRGRRLWSSQERTLLDVGGEGQSHIFYGKGAVAMYTLRDLIGSDAVNDGLRSFLARYEHAEPPFATSYDLYRELKAVTPDTLHSMLDDLFAKITLWEVGTSEAVATPLGDGRYEVALDVIARKTVYDTLGVGTTVPMHDLIEVGVYGSEEDGVDTDLPIYLERHRIRDGEQTIVVTVDGRPGRAGIDPRRRLIQRQPRDNVRDVTLRQ